jgi:hypothetical protein
VHGFPRGGHAHVGFRVRFYVELRGPVAQADYELVMLFVFTCIDSIRMLTIDQSGAAKRARLESPAVLPHASATGPGAFEPPPLVCHEAATSRLTLPSWENSELSEALERWLDEIDEAALSLRSAHAEGIGTGACR